MIFLDTDFISLGDPESKPVSIITELHKEDNVILYDDFSKYYSPPVAMMSLLKELRLNPVKFSGQCLGVNELFCSETKKKIVTFVFKGNELNPYRMKRNYDRGISRLMKQIKQLRVLQNCFIDVKGERKSYAGADYMCCLDLTFPLPFRKLYEKDRKAFEKLMNKCTKDVYNLLKKEFGGDLFFWNNKHVWKTELPCGTSHPHLHINFLNIAKTKDGWKRFSPYFEDEAKLIKEIWLKVLTKRMKYEGEVIYFGKRGERKYKKINANAHYIPLEEVARLRLRLKYCARSPVYDFFDYYGKNVYDEKKVNKENCKYLLTEFKNRRIAYGYACSIARYCGEIDDRPECPCDTGILVHESTWTLREFKDQGFMEDYKYFIMYLRGGRVAVYPIIHPERSRKKIGKVEKLEESPILRTS